MLVTCDVCSTSSPTHGTPTGLPWRPHQKTWEPSPYQSRDLVTVVMMSLPLSQQPTWLQQHSQHPQQYVLSKWQAPVSAIGEMPAEWRPMPGHL